MDTLDPLHRAVPEIHLTREQARGSRRWWLVCSHPGPLEPQARPHDPDHSVHRVSLGPQGLVVILDLKQQGQISESFFPQRELELLMDPHLVFGRIELRLETGADALLAHALSLVPRHVALGDCRILVSLETYSQ